MLNKIMLIPAINEKKCDKKFLDIMRKPILLPNYIVQM